MPVDIQMTGTARLAYDELNQKLNEIFSDKTESRPIFEAKIPLNQWLDQNDMEIVIKDELKELKEHSRKLWHLENCGVCDFERYNEAMEDYENEVKNG